jgi:hypothetical protein
MAIQQVSIFFFRALRNPGLLFRSSGAGTGDPGYNCAFALTPLIMEWNHNRQLRQ